MATDYTSYLTGLFQNAYGRAPDAGGLSFWNDALNNGMSQAEVSAAFYGSPEYTSLHPPGAGTGYQVPGGSMIQDYSSDRAALMAEIQATQAKIADVKAKIAQKKSQGWSLPVGGGGSGAPVAGTVTDNGAIGTPTNLSVSGWTDLTGTPIPMTPLQQAAQQSAASQVKF